MRDATLRDISDIGITLTPYIGVLANPVAGEFVGDHLFVVEQNGLIKVYSQLDAISPVLLQTINLDLSLSGDNEQGLLGLATEPEFEAKMNSGEPAAIFINFTQANGNTVIGKFNVTFNGSDFSYTDMVEEILIIDQPFSNHNGGLTSFWP